jgi:manganese oxidase
MYASIRRRALATLVLFLVATACTGGGATGAGGGEQAAGPPTTVEVMLSDFEISPSTIQVPPGVPISFSVMNMGQTEHTFALDANGTTYDTGSIKAGATVSLDVPALDDGSYDAYCSVSGHKDLGMVATVVASVDTTGTGTTGSAHSAMSADDMASLHEQGVKDFLAGDQTASAGNQPLKPTMKDGVKVFTLVASEVQWEVSKGQFVTAMAFNGQVPGPEIRVGYGDRVGFVLVNQLEQPTALHFHGMTVPNAADGVPYVTQPAVMPGNSWAYEFTVKDPPGMYVYHSHFNSTEQVGSGLYGAVMVEPNDGGWPYHAAEVNARTGDVTVGGAPVAIDDEYTMFLGDGPLGYVLNGKSFPATSPLVASKGDWVLIHLANDGAMLHPMHLHGYHFEVVAQDGFPLENPYMADTLVIAPGQRFDVLVHAVYPGAWAFHCHILPHVEGPQGMYGMVTALVVQ